MLKALTYYVIVVKIPCRPITSHMKKNRVSLEHSNLDKHIRLRSRRMAFPTQQWSVLWQYYTSYNISGLITL